MTESQRQPPDFEVRPPVWTRTLQGSVGGLGLFVAIVVTITLVARQTPWAVLAGLALVVWCVYFSRLVRIAVSVRGDTLVVRNLFRTRRLHRSSVADLTLGESQVAKSPNLTVVVQLTGGSELPIDACARSTDSRRRRRRVEEIQRYLLEWSNGVGPEEEVPAAERAQHAERAEPPEHAAPPEHAEPAEPAPAPEVGSEP